MISLAGFFTQGYSRAMLPGFHRDYMKVHSLLPEFIARYLPSCDHQQYCGPLEAGRVEGEEIAQQNGVLNAIRTCAVTCIFFQSICRLTVCAALGAIDLTFGPPIRDLFATGKHLLQLTSFHVGTVLLYEICRHNVLPKGNEGIPLLMRSVFRIWLTTFALSLFFEVGCLEGYSIRKALYYTMSFYCVIEEIFVGLYQLVRDIYPNNIRQRGRA